MVLPSKLSRRTRNFGYRLGLRRRLEKEDVVCFLLFVVGSFLILVFYVVRAHWRLIWSVESEDW